MDSERGLYTIGLAGYGAGGTLRTIGLAEYGEGGITFEGQITFQSNIETVRETVDALNAENCRWRSYFTDSGRLELTRRKGDYVLIARALGDWCRLCHRRIKGREGLCFGCEWIAEVHGIENAIGLCAADGERSLLRAFDIPISEKPSREKGYIILGGSVGGLIAQRGGLHGALPATTAAG